MLYDYFVNNVSPSIISVKYRVPKYVIRGYAQQVYSKTRLGPVATAKHVVRKHEDFIDEVVDRVLEKLVRTVKAMPIQSHSH